VAIKPFLFEKAPFSIWVGYNGHFVIMEEYDFLRRAMPRYPLCIIPKYATVSARKYERNSWLRVQISNFLVFSLFRLGVAPVKLKRLYGGLLS
jgi:hypothetical protein